MDAPPYIDPPGLFIGNKKGKKSDGRGIYIACKGSFSHMCAPTPHNGIMGYTEKRGGAHSLVASEFAMDPGGNRCCCPAPSFDSTM